MEHAPRTAASKVATAVMSLALLVSVAGAAFPRPAQAQLVVVDPTNLVQNTLNAINSAASYTKDYVLDTLAWQVGNLAIQSLTKSIVNWINSGFQGSPAFVTDLNQNLQGVGDAVANRFFSELSQQTIAITPFQNKVLDSVRLGYYLRTSPESFYTKHPYTLNQVSSDDKAFLAGDFSQGGFNAWFETILNPQNNPYGARDLAEQALTNTVANVTSNRLQELSWNRGFLSWRGECTAQKPLVSAEEAAAGAASVPLGGEDTCASYEIKTPGSVIMEQLNTQLGSNVNRLVSADEFNEILGALMNQLVSKVLGGGDGGGLSGVSRPSAGGGASYLDQATSPSQSGGASTDIARSFAATITRQRTFVAEYQASWNKIREAALAVPSRCSASGQPTPQETITRSASALADAANSMAALDAIQTRITALNDAGGNQTESLIAISADYSALTSSDTLPSAEEIAEAKVESSDTGDAEPGSVYSQMVRLAASRTCDVSE